MDKKTTNILIGFSTIVAGIFIVRFFNRTISETKKIQEDEDSEEDEISSENAVWDKNSEKLIQTLHPKIRGKARAFINEAYKQGFKLKVTSGLRTYEKQTELYAQGRTKKGGIVTNAKAGYSWHNFGNAFDIVPIENGKANYKSKNWNKIGSLGKSFGFEWGGDWTSFIDKPHFQDRFGLTTAQARQRKSDNKTDVNGYLLV